MHLGEKVFLCDDAVFDLVLAASDGNNIIKEYFKNRSACPDKISPTLCFVLLQMQHIPRCATLHTSYLPNCEELHT